MKLPELGVKRPVFTGVIFAVILALGVISSILLPIDLLPEIEQPTLSIITPYLGVGAEDIETQVSKKIENGISGTANLEEISSISKDNISVVVLKFAWGTDLNEAMDEARIKLEFTIRELPSDIEPPQMFKFNTAQFPVVFFGITADKSWADLRTLVEKRVADPLKTIPGVGTVRIIAGLKRQINIEVDLDRLKAFPSISITQIGQAIAGENMTVPIGDITLSQKALTVRLPGEFKSPDEINDIIVGANEEGRVIRVKDIARVVDGFKEQDERVFFNGNPSIMFMVMKQTGGNTVQVVDAVNKRLEDIKKTLPEDIKIYKLYDTAEFISDSISNLKTTIYYGGFLVILVVWLFLRNVRSSLIVAATIPYSLILAFVFMYFLKYTINMMSLMSLAIAIGMVVDNAIVVFENITRHLEEGQKLNKACIDGTSEVGLAVSASTYTNLVIFIPLLFIGGISGVMFRQLGFIITVTMLGSLFASLTLTPMMASKLMRKYAPDDIGFTDKSRKLGVYRTFETTYLGILDWALSNRKKTVIGSILIFLFLLIAPSPLYHFEFMPDEDTGDVRINAELAPGTDVDVTTRVGLQIVDILQQKLYGKQGQREWDAVFMRTGQSVSGFSTAIGEREGNNILECGARLIRRAERTRSSFEYADIVRPLLQEIPGVIRMSINAGNAMNTFIGGGGKPVSIEIKGSDFKQTNEYAGRIAERLKSLAGITDVTVSRDAGKANINLNIDRQRLAMMGLNTGYAAMQLRASIFGSIIGQYRQGDDQFDILLRLRDADRQSIESLETVPVLNMAGKQVTLGNIARLEESVTPIQIDRLDQERVIKVEANTAKSADLQRLTQQIQNVLKQDPPPDPRAISVHLGGNIEKMSDAFRDLALVALLGLFLVYVVMAAQFENLVDPFIIMFAVPFALNGVLIAIVLTGITFTVYTFLGVIMLIGVVVNNAIVFVDYTNILRRRGIELTEALKVSGKNRLRPVLMTTITTIVGMVPMALSRSEGSEFWRPLGISVIGGLIFATLITLVLIPTLYHITYSFLGRHGMGERKDIVIQ